jgi:formamidopyrimidine-DNA glycosylase
MPELPEVETVVRELRDEVLFKTIKSYYVYWNKTFIADSNYELNGLQITELARKGKYIIISLSQSFLIIHLRMTGKLLFHKQKTEVQKHDRFLIEFNDNTQLVFNDIRKFGRIHHTDLPEKILHRVGIDAMDPDLSSDYFYSMLRKSRRNIKAFLLSQEYISGLGNIYVDESLFRAAISPFSICANISEEKAGKLLDIIKEILTFAIKNMGTTISDYRDAFGNFGKNQQFLQVYQRGGLSCFKCGTAIKRIIFAGRGTHYCPVCQKTL